MTFEVRLDAVDPAPWRRFSLPVGATFLDLHEAIQDACSWTNSHLWCFVNRQGHPLAGIPKNDPWGRPSDEDDPDASEILLLDGFDAGSSAFTPTTSATTGGTSSHSSDANIWNNDATGVCSLASTSSHRKTAAAPPGTHEASKRSGPAEIPGQRPEKMDRSSLSGSTAGDPTGSIWRRSEVGSSEWIRRSSLDASPAQFGAAIYMRAGTRSPAVVRVGANVKEPQSSSGMARPI